MSENSSSCTIADSEVTFSNADHLEWNQKKHDMMLNLGLTNNNSEADQTPTPTRFIRNCEEVGLFQDLQNVNPFDEVFKKAVENPTSITLKVPVSSSDDTLHTPQIYPHLEENTKISSTSRSTSNDFSLSGVISSIEQERDDGDNPLIIVLEPETDEKTPMDCEKNKTNTSPSEITSKDMLKDKMKQKVMAAIIQKASSGVTPIPIDKLIDSEKQKPKTSQNNINMTELLRQREANKAAQSRCRKRKQREFEEMNTEILNLRRENLRLSGMNIYLQETVKKLEGELKATRPPSLLEHDAIPVPTIPSETLPVLSPIQPTNNKQLEPVVIGNAVKVIISPNEPNKLQSIARNVKTVVMASPSSLSLPVQNLQTSSNNTVVVLYQGYMPSQNVIVPPAPILTQPVNLDLNSKVKTNYKKIVPK